MISKGTKVAEGLRLAACCPGCRSQVAQQLAFQGAPKHIHKL